VTTLVPIAAVAAMSAPSLALVLATAAPNKVAGFAVVKLLNVINLLPIVAFCVPPPLQYGAGVLPAFWPMRALWSAAAGTPFMMYLLVGSIVGAAAIAITGAFFDRRLLRRASPCILAGSVAHCRLPLPNNVDRRCSTQGTANRTIGRHHPSAAAPRFRRAFCPYRGLNHSLCVGKRCVSHRLGQLVEGSNDRGR
jgi:hypothetical protein